MPLYEYKCTQCKRHTEKRQKFSDPEITLCPHCGGTLERVISAPAIAFKGGGWYKDGYGSSAPQGSKPKSEGDSAASGGPSNDSGGGAAAPAADGAAAAAPSTPAAGTPAPAPAASAAPSSDKS